MSRVHAEHHKHALHPERDITQEHPAGPVECLHVVQEDHGLAERAGRAADDLGEGAGRSGWVSVSRVKGCTRTRLCLLHELQKYCLRTETRPTALTPTTLLVPILVHLSYRRIANGNRWSTISSQYSP